MPLFPLATAIANVTKPSQKKDPNRFISTYGTFDEQREVNGEKIRKDHSSSETEHMLYFPLTPDEKQSSNTPINK